MKTDIIRRPFTIKDWVLQSCIFAAAVFLLVYFMPRESHFGYTFDLNKPWKYEQVIAKYDFPIYKSNEQLRHERDSVLNLFQPYFDKNLTTAATQIQALRNDFLNGKIRGVPAGYLPYLIQMLQKVYDQGIISNEDLVHLSDSNVTNIRVVYGTEAQSYPVKGLHSQRSAYAFIMQADTVHFRRELLYNCNLNNYIEPNLNYDNIKSDATRAEMLATISYASGMVVNGQKIIDRGEIVDARTYRILESLERESLKRNDSVQEYRQMIVGQTLFTAIVLALFLIYLMLFRHDYFDKPNSLWMLYALMVIFPVAAFLITSTNPDAVYMVPFAIIPIFVRIFMDTRTAFTTFVFTLLLASVAQQSPFEFLLIQFVAGSSAIYTLKELTQRSQLLRTAAIATTVSFVTAYAYDLIQGSAPFVLDKPWYIYIVINGILLLFAYPLMVLVEKVFGFTSSVTLIELSNINTPLLRQMSKVAQGTFNHSLQVANLASEVANKIGAKVQLVRTGALYHDIGKMENPAFFTENQTSVNPHDSLPEERSAQIIINHVRDGLRLADKHHLPKVLRDFIATHHGRSKTKYFYISYVNKHPEETVDEELFTYPGPNPTTREQAILMMADSIEAASRSLKEINEESIRELVNRIIDTQMKERLLLSCDLTFKDIATAKEVFIENLKTIYHTRISYPELNKPAEPQQQRPGRFTAGLHRNKR